MKQAKVLKQRLIEQSVKRKLSRLERSTELSSAGNSNYQNQTDFKLHPGWKQLEIMRQGGERLGIDALFFRVHEGCSGATAVVNGKTCINFASYNYLGLSCDQRVIVASIKAAEHYGVSVSASRIVSGERPIHRELETALAEIYQADDALAFVSGHATNVSVIGYLMGGKDLVIHDEYIHNSSLIGAQLSGAQRMSFPHNDLGALEQLLLKHRSRFERVLIVTEGLYSMDGDSVDLNAIVDIKHRHGCWLMVDEAHALGVMGEQGLGSHEHHGVAPQDIDIWMGTLSKTLSGCGGYIAGTQALIDILRHYAPGFLYSVGMPAPVAAAALESLQIMRLEKDRVKKLQENSEYLAERGKQLGLDVGTCIGRAVVPVMIGGSVPAARLSSVLFDQGINIQPILYPAVPEKSARLRFFISSEHNKDQIDQSLNALVQAKNKL